jgi:hypothetical protein
MMSHSSLFIALAIGFSAVICAAQPATQPAVHPPIEVVAYVPTTTVQYMSRLPIVLEVTNNTEVPFRVLDFPLGDKITELDVKPIEPTGHLAAPKDQPLALGLVVQTVYPTFTELSGYAISTAFHPRYTLCQPGQSVLVKTYVPKEIFQPGHCRLLVTLRYVAADTPPKGRNVARSQSIDLDVVQEK